MATLMERDVALVTKDASGNTVIEYPLTRAEQVEDLADAIKAQAPSPANMKGATTSEAGTAGLAPAPAAGEANRYLRSDGTWAVPPDTKAANMKGATTDAAGTAGLAPAPAAGTANRYLRSDGTWAVPPDTNTTYKAGTGLTLSGTTFSLNSSVSANAGVAAYKIPYATCTTGSSTVAKVATITNGVPFSLVAGALCVVQMSYDWRQYYDTSTLTMNINNTGAKTCSNTDKSAPAYIYNRTTVLLYNGSRYIGLSGAMNTYEDYSGDSG